MGAVHVLPGRNDVTVTEAEATGTVHTLVARDGKQLHYRYFPATPERERGRIIYLHGIQSHGGWYVDAAAELGRRGYTVYLPDRRGSGLNTGSRGYTRSRAQLVDDLRAFVALSEREHSGAPLFLIGNCWGAKPAVAFALREPRTLAGMILLCPGIVTRPDLPLAQKLRVLVGRVVAPRWRARVPLTDEMYTANPPYLQFIHDDPLMMREATTQFFVDSFLWERTQPKQYGLRVPLLAMQAGRDPVVDVPATRRWFDRLTSTDKRWQDYPDACHTFDFEEDRQRYWDDMVAWLDRHTDTHGSASESAPRSHTVRRGGEAGAPREDEQ